MARRIQLRRDTATAWSTANPVLSQGEIGLDLTSKKIKIGDGTTLWNALAYWDDNETDLAGYATEQYVDNAIGAIVIPDVSNFITADDIPRDYQGEQVFTVDTGSTDYAPTAVDFNLLFVTPAIGYTSADPTSVTLPNGVPGQRLVIFNSSSLATLTVNPGPFGRDISVGVIAEFIFSDIDGWIPLYGTNSPT